MKSTQSTLVFASSSLGLAAAGLIIAAASLLTLGAEDHKEISAATSKTTSTDMAKTVIGTYCVSCHGAEKQKGGIRLDTIDHDIVRGKDSEVWQLVLDQLNLGDMPPKKSDQPKHAERRALVDRLTTSLKEAAILNSQDVRVVMRRLTKAQYSNALRDLLNLDVDFGKELPSEMLSVDGFTNNGSDQITSLLQTEYFMTIAEKALAKAIVTDAPPTIYRYAFAFGKDINKDSKQRRARRKNGNHEVPVNNDDYIVATSERKADTPTFVKTGKHTRCYADLRGAKKKRFSMDTDGIVLPPAIPHLEYGSLIWLAPAPSLKLHLRDFPTEGEFVLRVTVAKADASKEAPYIRAMVGEWLDHGEDYLPLEQAVRVTGTREAPQVVEFRGRLENFPVPVFDPAQKDIATMLVVGIWNDCLARRSDEKAPAVLIKSMELECGGPQTWPPKSQQQILIASEHSGDDATYSRQIIANFMRRAFRRPIDKAEIDAYHELWRSVRPDCATFEQSIRETLAGVLVSPHFLYLVESGSKINEYQLASRLAALLWNSVPDQRLLDLAEKSQLRQRLASEFDRMVDDPKSQRFVKSFCAEWLQIEKMTHTRIDRRKFPRYNRFVRDDMIRETEHFFNEILQKDLSIINFIDSDFTMLNQNLAQFYGINDVKGANFRRVALDESSPRGGLMSQGVFLAGNSNGKEPHPIKRGAWLISRLLDDPPPPPPPNVPQLDENEPEFANLSIKEQLAKHRDNPACADCHNKVDPWGLVFENYNAVGLWKHRDGSAHVTLPNGVSLDSAAALKAYLVAEKKEKFTRGMVQSLARYALGRSLSFTDNEDINSIVDRVKKDDYRFRRLLLALVESPLFTRR